MRRYNIRHWCTLNGVLLDRSWCLLPCVSTHCYIMSTIIWGWQQYFAELAQFLDYANRNLGLADEDCSANITDRLQVLGT